jgi:excisionase family DNA binding protein
MDSRTTADRQDAWDVPVGDSDWDRPGRPDEPLPDLAITTAEAAKIAGVSPRTIRRWIEKGALPAVTGAGGVLYVFPHELEAARIASGSRPSPVARDRRDDRGVPDRDSVRTKWDDRDVAGASALSPDPTGDTAGAILVAWRDTVLAPVVEELAATRREIGETRQALGRAEAERAQASRERDAAVAEVARLQAARELLGASPAPPESPSPPKLRDGLLARLRRLLGG